MNWDKAIQPLLEKYGKRKHPLDYKNTYQLVVMVILSAQNTDNAVNQHAPNFFKKYPTFQSLTKVTPEELMRDIRGIRFPFQKATRLILIADELAKRKDIPTTMEELVKLPGISRKSANLILRELGKPADGIMVDLHVMRVAPRIGIVRAERAEAIEKELMNRIPKEYWNDVGMALSYLGREICRPTKPKCPECVMNSVCVYYKRTKAAES